eukprot:CAMPEP_0171460824 /NCGR_PEP_ID=MMETSP0945-20130129/5542_1 /TAXON_ID=109269 /ORGANISM="Vaucheria litorea, Strain CCMP2940" /LENGTH=817 /DNA_ID=CAMNT_0011987097 /DNA_START=123 /DNA_END=2576 /DNA_ORIENTATION=+
MTTTPMRDVVLIGGGHSHVYVLKDIGANPIPGVQVTLIARDIQTPYSGMLPGHVAGHYTREQVHIDLNRLARYAGVRLIHASAIGLNRIERLIYCDDGRPPLKYDLCSIDVGCTPQFVPGRSPESLVHVTPVKPINGFSARWQLILERVRADQPRGSSRIVVVGGGAGGVELALSMQHRLKKELKEAGYNENGVSVALISRGPVPMEAHGKQAQRTFTKLLKNRQIELYLGSPAIEVIENECERGGTILLENGGVIHFDEVFWCTTSGAAPWFKTTGLDLGPDGFIQVSPTLQSTNDPAVFASGDCADMVASPRPKAGVFAVRQGPPLAHNIRAFLDEKRFMRYMPQKNFMCIIGVGGEDAVVVYGGHVSSGAWAWKWKRKIDEQWIQQYQKIPFNDSNAASDDFSKLLSYSYVEVSGASLANLKGLSAKQGPYGSKIGPELLNRVLHGAHSAAIINDSSGTSIGSYRGAMPILLRQDESSGLTVKSKTYSVDLFRSYVTDPYKFGRIVANHALTDVYVQGLLPETALIFAILPRSGESQAENTLMQLVSGALRMFKEADCDLVGGHTSEGPELALGFYVNTSAPPEKPISTPCMSVGDRLIVTKAIGTGILLAANLRARAKGRWMDSAIISMLESNASATVLFRHYKATSINSISVEGLAGNILSMIRSSNEKEEIDNDSRVRAQLQLDDIPQLDGALSLAIQGILSSRHSFNQRAYAPAVTPSSSFQLMIDATKRVRKLENSNARDLVMAHYNMLFDPQTAGGLIASVPEEHADDCLLALRGKGYHLSSIVGEVTPTTGRSGEKEIIFKWNDEMC